MFNNSCITLTNTFLFAILSKTRDKYSKGILEAKIRRYGKIIEIRVANGEGPAPSVPFGTSPPNTQQNLDWQIYSGARIWGRRGEGAVQGPNPRPSRFAAGCCAIFPRGASMTHVIEVGDGGWPLRSATGSPKSKNGDFMLRECHLARGVSFFCVLEEGQSRVWVYNSNMPIGNINPGQILLVLFSLMTKLFREIV